MEESKKAAVKSAGNKTAGKTAPKSVRSEVSLPSIEELLNAGSHFGHQKSRWNPKMDQYIYTRRGGVHIIDLVQTLKLLKVALAKIQEVSDQKSVLIIGTKGQAASMVKNVAEEVGAYYVNRRWPGGLFTNFDTIKKSVVRLVKLEEKLASGAEDLVKKERLMLKREVQRLNRLYEGIKFMDRLPGLVIVIDSKVEKNAVRESKLANVPIVSMIDTNGDPDGIDFLIPANDDSMKSITLFMELFRKALAGGKRADAVRSLRNSHTGELKRRAADYAENIERATKQAEEEADRLKMMRTGEMVVEGAGGKKTAVVRVVKKVKPEAEAKEAEKTVVAKKPATKKATKKVEPKKVVKKAAKVVAKKIADLELGARTEKALEEAGVKTVAALKKLSDTALTEIKGVGAAAVKKIKAALK